MRAVACDWLEDLQLPVFLASHWLHFSHNIKKIDQSEQGVMSGTASVDSVPGATAGAYAVQNGIVRSATNPDWQELLLIIFVAEKLDTNKLIGVCTGLDCTCSVHGEGFPRDLDRNQIAAIRGQVDRIQKSICKKNAPSIRGRVLRMRAIDRGWIIGIHSGNPMIT
ncbi:hypothetical protein VTN31DRAFT_6370 [Thermomyces dupontii]|uniref:uncharacterized protein n=1 Tax=Talaromyces thermophilus TaxID=28565 RepID=UPI0037437871